MLEQQLKDAFRTLEDRGMTSGDGDPDDPVTTFEDTDSFLEYITN